MSISPMNVLSLVLSVFSIVLLLFTAYLSSRNYKSRIRFAIRESLEQSDDLAISGSVKLKPVLYDFDHRWFRPSTTRVLIEHYNYKRPNLPGTNHLEEPFWYLDDEEEITQVLRALPNVGSVTDAETTDDGVVISCRGHDPVEVRNSTRSAMTALRNRFFQESEVSRRRFG